MVPVDVVKGHFMKGSSLSDTKAEQAEVIVACCQSLQSVQQYPYAEGAKGKGRREREGRRGDIRRRRSRGDPGAPQGHNAKRQEGSYSGVSIDGRQQDQRSIQA